MFVMFVGLIVSNQGGLWINHHLVSMKLSGVKCGAWVKEEPKSRGGYTNYVSLNVAK